MFIEQPDFIYFECQVCEFNSVQKSTFQGSRTCPLCEADTGRIVNMYKRVCYASDKPEGFDARKVIK